MLSKYAILVLLTSPLFGATYNAATCNLNDIQSIYTTEQASAVDGDVIIIPSGTCTWASSWAPTPSNSLTFQGQTVVAGTCSPVAGGTCTPTDNTIINLGNTVSWRTSVATGKTVRTTGITINPGGSTAQDSGGSIGFNCSSSTIRFDHNHVNDTVAGDHTFEHASCVGVIDHNYFDSSNSANLFFIEGSINGADGNSNEVWTRSESFGASTEWLFIENNFFVNGHFIFDCDYGAKYVLRFNTGWFNTRIQVHGTGSGAQRRGCRAMEVYENTFTFSNSPNTNAFAFLIDYEGGPMMFWGNTITAFSNVMREQVVRAIGGGSPSCPGAGTYCMVATPNGWGYCGTAYNGTGSAWDGSASSASGYPCIDQVGRGAGDLLTGSFPNLVNQTTGTIAWPHQALVPTYAWASTQNTNTFAANHFFATLESAAGAPARVTENTDYYLQLPNVDEAATFNGTAGVGSGALASRPGGTCTLGVGYWATDQGSWNGSGNGVGNGVLYTCQSSNGTGCVASGSNFYCPYYTPYTYPNPLTGAAVVSPTLTTTTAANVTTTSASSGGTISNDGGATPTAVGVCYAITANPTSPCTSDSIPSPDTNPFVSNMTGLSQGTVYHYRAYATNSGGTGYGADNTFTTGTTPAIHVSSGPGVISGIH